MPHKLPFRVIHVSGQDDQYKASELNYHSPLTKGWQAARYCLYPQDIVIQIDQKSRLKKIQILAHQFCIATKVEFFVGDVPEDLPVAIENARYTRLGYVSLSDNEKTGYKARELKSVHVDASGQYLKLLIHKNHINKYNLYNQVGVIAVNVIGEELVRPTDYTDPDFYLDPEKKRLLENDPTMSGLYDRPDYISPLDDLAFDMYQDPEVAKIIRKLEKKKQESVLQERFDFAKKLKQAITDLQKVGEKLGKFEVEKRQAVENEDYDKAKLKKVQMDDYREQVYRDLNLSELMDGDYDRPPPPSVRREPPPRQRTPPPALEPPRSPQYSPPRTPYDERPLPAMKSSEQPEQTTNTPSPLPYDERPLPAMKNNKGQSQLTPSPSPPRLPYDERPLPAQKNKGSLVEEEEIADVNAGITGEPEPMTEKDLREASTAIDVFGQALVSKAYSKTWSYREDALLAVYKQLQDLPASSSKDEAKTLMRAAVFLIKRSIDDKVYAVFKAALQLLKMILTDFCPRFKIARPDTIYAVERTLTNLLHKTGDTAVRNRDDAKKYILEMANYPEVKPTNIVPHECVKPFKLTIAPRLAQSRCEIVEMLYKDLGLTPSGLTTDSIMQFCVQALNHTAGEVREVAERIIKTLYKEVGQPVKDYLPPDDDKARKNTLYRQLFEFFDKVDGKPSRSDMKKTKAEDETKKQAEIEALQKQLQQLKDMAAGKQPVDENLVKGQQRKPAKGEPKKAENKNKPKRAPAPRKGADDDEISMYNMDNICIFCGERNASFTEEGLDLHYWKNCPMLKRCANCKQVVEIASYTEHLLTECDAKTNYSKCPRCSEAIPKSDYDGHVAEKSCNAAKDKMLHCPLCHQNLTAGEDSWKNHLMGPGKDGCKQNPRRLLSLNKTAPSGKTGTAAAVKTNKPKAAPKKTPR